jgi:hypothetical protein
MFEHFRGLMPRVDIAFRVRRLRKIINAGARSLSFTALKTVP